MIWHATKKCTEPGKMQHPVDGRAWKKFDTMYPDFAKEPRNVRLGLAVDGFNSFGNLSQAYNMWSMSADVARGHGGDGGGDDRPPPYQVPTGCGGCLGNRGHPKAQFGWQESGQAAYPPAWTRNLGLKAITDKSGPVPIRFEVNDRETLMPLGDHAAHWANYLGELVRELPLHYPSWRQMSPERKAGVVAKIGMETSATREYPSLIHTFFLTHTVGGVFLNPEDKALYQLGAHSGVGRVLPGQGTVIPPPSQSTHSTDIARLKKREKHLTKQVNMFMRLFRSDDKFSQMLNQFESQPEYGGGSGSGGCGDDEPGDDEDGGEDEDDS
ncbi:reverse transcriptase domain-containing protein [Tanacetum coccineum]